MKRLGLLERVSRLKGASKTSKKKPTPSEIWKHQKEEMVLKFSPKGQTSELKLPVKFRCQIVSNFPIIQETRWQWRNVFKNVRHNYFQSKTLYPENYQLFLILY